MAFKKEYFQGALAVIVLLVLFNLLMPEMFNAFIINNLPNSDVVHNVAIKDSVLRKKINTVNTNLNNIFLIQGAKFCKEKKSINAMIKKSMKDYRTNQKLNPKQVNLICNIKKESMNNTNNGSNRSNNNGSNSNNNGSNSNWSNSNNSNSNWSNSNNSNWSNSNNSNSNWSNSNNSNSNWSNSNSMFNIIPNEQMKQMMTMTVSSSSYVKAFEKLQMSITDLMQYTLTTHFCKKGVLSIDKLEAHLLNMVEQICSDTDHTATVYNKFVKYNISKPFEFI